MRVLRKEMKKLGFYLCNFTGRQLKPRRLQTPKTYNWSDFLLQRLQLLCGHGMDKVQRFLALCRYIVIIVSYIASKATICIMEGPGADTFGEDMFWQP